MPKYERYILWWPGENLDEMYGFARVRNKIIASLRGAGFFVYDVGYKPPKDCIQISYGQPFDTKDYRQIWDRKEGVKLSVGFTSFESSNLPKGWASACKQHDLIWTTSNFCRNVFEKDLRLSNIQKPPVKNITHGVDGGCFPLMDRPTRGTKSNPFTFFWRGMHPLDRKRGFFVADVFKKIKIPNTRLVVKSSPIAGPKCYFMNEDNIDWICDFWTDNQMRSFLYNTDCLIQPSRCEGFGLEPLESLATGQPVMITAFSGYMDYLYDGADVWSENDFKFTNNNYFKNGDGILSAIGYPLKYELVDSFYHTEARRLANNSDTPRMTSLLHTDYDYGNDALVTEDELANAMIFAYENRVEMKRLAMKAAHIVHARHNWNICVKDMIDSLSCVIDLNLIAYDRPKVYPHYLHYFNTNPDFKFTKPMAEGKEMEFGDDIVDLENLRV